jgi:hypothetical protein
LARCAIAKRSATESDLKRLEELINKRFDSLESEQKEIDKKLNDIRVDIAILKEGQNIISKRITVSVRE